MILHGVLHSQLFMSRTLFLLQLMDDGLIRVGLLTEDEAVHGHLPVVDGGAVALELVDDLTFVESIPVDLLGGTARDGVVMRHYDG